MSQDDWAEGFVETNGTRLHYTRTGGDGPPLVLAHGYYDDALCRTPLIRELDGDAPGDPESTADSATADTAGPSQSSGYDVIAYDARGHGRSDAPEDGYDIDDRVADLVCLLDALAIPEAILVGHSMGGSTVAATAAQHPDRVRAVVMIDPAGMLDIDSDPDERVADIREQIRWWHDHSKAELLIEDDELRGHVEAGDEELAELLADARLRLSQQIVEIASAGYPNPETVYPDIDVPALILKADADDAGRARDRSTAALLPHGRLVHVDDAGHCVFRDERATATEALRGFLAGL